MDSNADPNRPVIAPKAGTPAFGAADGMPDERFAPSGPVDIAYEEIGDSSGRPILLVPGLGTQMIHWDSELCGMLAARGFRVIRMENRDSGHSTVLSDEGLPDPVSLFLGLKRGLRYGLEEMADDAIAVLDHLGIERADLAGFSMGGMIVQAAVLRHPERVSALTSIMSRTGHRADAAPDPRHGLALLKTRPDDLESFIWHMKRLSAVIGSPAYRPDPERLERMARMSWARGIHPEGTARQLHAVNTQTDRTGRLGEVRAPTLVIHGAADRLVFPRGGRRTAAAIPDARLRVFEGMGHDLPSQLWPRFAAEIEANALRTGAD
jgi:pimeloyl-ACP methyl ester carboxylesterase